MINPRVAAQPIYRLEARSRVNRPRRIIRRHGDDGSSTRRNGRGQRIDIELIIVHGRHEHRLAAEHDDRHFVIKVIWRRQNDFISRVGNRQHGVEKRHVSPGAYHNAAAGQIRFVFARKFFGDQLQQLRNSFHGFVFMILRIGPKSPSGLERLRRRTIMHDSLPQRNRPWRRAHQIAHDRNDRCLNRLHATRGTWSERHGRFA